MYLEFSWYGIFINFFFPDVFSSFGFPDRFDFPIILFILVVNLNVVYKHTSINILEVKTKSVTFCFLILIEIMPCDL